MINKERRILTKNGIDNTTVAQMVQENFKTGNWCNL